MQRIIIACTGAGKLKPASFEVGEVAQHLGNRRSRMGASRDGRCKELIQFSIGRANTRQAVVVLQVIPDLLYCYEVHDGRLD